MPIALPENLTPLFETIASEAQHHNLGLYLVGGFVRDLLLGRPNTDIDLVVEGNAIDFVKYLQQHYGGKVEAHPPFGTATWSAAELITNSGLDFIDFATARTET